MQLISNTNVPLCLKKRNDSLGSVSTRHHQTESEKVNSSAKPKKPMEKIAPAPIYTVMNKPTGKEIAPGLKLSSMYSMGKKIAPGGYKPVGKKIAPQEYNFNTIFL